jgi:bacteriorhodopsin
MKNEMDALRMDERQRLYWMMANRFTLIIVGLVWIGMVAYEAAYNHRVAYFLIAMIPIFALIRFAAYKIYARRG